MATESDIYLWLACDSAEEIMAHALRQYAILHQISNWEMECTVCENIASTEAVDPDPVTWNVLTMLSMYDARKEFSESFPGEKLCVLPPLIYARQMILHRIDVRPKRHWSQGFPSTYNHCTHQITEKINM